MNTSRRKATLRTASPTFRRLDRTARVHAVIQRIRDWLHEREIRRLGNACAEAMEAHDTPKAVHFWAAHIAAINARSPSQVARMERKRGLAE